MEAQAGLFAPLKNSLKKRLAIRSFLYQKKGRMQLNSRERFVRALRGARVDRPPVWVMRQAGRYLPEYRALKQRYSFLDMVRTPQLAAEVTMQPMNRFDLDAAIIFSDILVIPEALGFGYHFRSSGGIEMDHTLRFENDLVKLDTSKILDRLKYVSHAIKAVRREMGHERGLIGFSGSPWTLATYMIEGGSSKHFDLIKSCYYREKSFFNMLMRHLTNAVIEYLNMQIECGVDAVQIFDSWGHLCTWEDYPSASLDWINEVVKGLKTDVPVILYVKQHCAGHLRSIRESGINVVSLDWATPLPQLYQRARDMGLALQGNMDPCLMSTDPNCVKREVARFLSRFPANEGFVLNLGHGIHPTARPECVQAFVEAAQSYEASTPQGDDNEVEASV